MIERVTVLGDTPLGGKPRWEAFHSDQYSTGSGATTARPSRGVATDPRTNSIAKPA